MGSIFFQDPSTEGAPGIWELEDAMRHQAMGRWPTIPATVPDWVKRGPDGALPIDQADYVLGKGWFNGQPYPNLHAYMDAAGGAFSRGSDATYFGKSGQMRTAGPNVLRLTHDRVTGEALGYLSESSRVNMLANSKFEGALSGTPGSTPTGWSSVGSTGAMDVSGSKLPGASKITFSIPSSGGQLLMQQSVSLAARTAYLFSVEIDVSEGDLSVWQYIGLSSAPTGSTVEWLIDGAVAEGHTLLVTGRHVIGVRVTTGDTAGSSILRLGAGVQGSVAMISATFDLPQLEAGQFRSSYIPTPTSSAATRLADNLTFARAGSPEATVFIRGRTPRVSLISGSTLWQWDSGSANSRHVLYWLDRRLRYLTTNAGISSNLDLGALAGNTDFGVAVSFKDGMLAGSLNGAPAVVNTGYAGSLPIVTTQRIGRSLAGGEWDGSVARTTIYDRAYSAAKIAGVSAL